jgi:very-short-patch-repair endonuclease
MDPVTALDRRLGASRWRALVAAGVTDGDLRGAVRRGQVLALGDGMYALPGAAPDAVVAARLRGRLTCRSAAVRYGLDLLSPPDVPHVAVPRNCSVDARDAVVHRVAVPGDGPVVPVLHALVAVLRCLETVEAVVVVDSALRRGVVRRRSLDARLRGPGSVIETIARLALRQAGLPVDCQVLVPGIGRVDLVIDGWLVVELDGFAYHSDRDRYRTDRRRTNGLVARGYRVLRFSYEDVMFRLADLVAQVVAVHSHGR